MPEFLDLHEGFRNLTKQWLDEWHGRDREHAAAAGVSFKHVWADAKTGRIFCLSEGPSKEAILAVHQKAGHPTHAIYELGLTAE